MFCILLMLLSSVDVALAKGKKKRAKKIQRTETVYEEIDNFDFLYADGYDTNISFASTDDILSQATSFIGTRYRLGSKGPQDSPAMYMVRTTLPSAIRRATSMHATSPFVVTRCSLAIWCSSPAHTQVAV